ncbi:hypothetical protein CIRG_07812 [Coccidioides immitis RMSCC 2394]|uniref:Uncharacterized protein n=1 Tax=Coccidioides immitis RMSCC 2394 TaxID=404692 RepID=A0A0J6YHH1_COCIT|nr:hypothetical protein CIRG_07812 [Coccidioides immitis RMSCC 2394]
MVGLMRVSRGLCHLRDWGAPFGWLYKRLSEPGNRRLSRRFKTPHWPRLYGIRTKYSCCWGAIFVSLTATEYARSRVHLYVSAVRNCGVQHVDLVPSAGHREVKPTEFHTADSIFALVTYACIFDIEFFSGWKICSDLHATEEATGSSNRPKLHNDGSELRASQAYRLILPSAGMKQGARNEVSK